MRVWTPPRGFTRTSLALVPCPYRTDWRQLVSLGVTQPMAPGRQVETAAPLPRREEDPLSNGRRTAFNRLVARRD